MADLARTGDTDVRVRGLPVGDPGLLTEDVCVNSNRLCTEDKIRPLQSGFHGQKTIGVTATTVIGTIVSGTITIQTISTAASRVVYVGFGSGVTTSGATGGFKLDRGQSLTIDVDTSMAQLYAIGSHSDCLICWIGGAP